MKPHPAQGQLDDYETLHKVPLRSHERNQIGDYDRDVFPTLTDMSRPGLKISVIFGYAAIRRARIASFGPLKSSCFLSVTDIVHKFELVLHFRQ